MPICHDAIVGLHCAICVDRCQKLKVDLVTNILDPTNQQFIDDAVKACEDAENQLRVIAANHTHSDTDSDNGPMHV